MRIGERLTKHIKALEEIKRINNSFPLNEAVKAWKWEGKKVFGWVCLYTPEEILYAADILPFRVTGGSGKIAAADAYLYSNICSFTRSCLELALNSEYSFLDGFVSGFTCDHIRRLSDVWKTYLPLPFIHILDIPHQVTEEANQFFKEEIYDLKEKLERHIKRKIGEEDLKEAIEIYNKTRNLLREIYELRKPKPPLISGHEIMEVLKAGMVLPKEKYNNLLEELLFALKNREPVSDEGVRLLITGSILDNPSFIRTIEALGGTVVADELCTGSRYFWDLVDLSLGPMEALARRYLQGARCARMHPFNIRFSHMKEMIQEFKVDGVIYQTIKFCDIYGHDEPRIKEELGKMGIPLLDLDVEYGVEAMGQVKTRVQAFIEMLS